MTNLSPNLCATGTSANLVRASALAALLALLHGCSTKANTDPATAPDLHQVARGDLRVTVSEDGEIQAYQETRVRSQMEGRVRIKYLIDEGSQVTAGQRLVELDSSDLVNQRASQAIAVAKAEASFTQAQENNRILAKELEATENAAESKLIIAKMELEKFLGRVNPLDETALGGNDDSQGTNLEMVQKLRALIEGDPISGPLYKGLVAKTLELLEIVGDEATGGALHRDMGELSNKVLQQVDRIRLAQADLKIKEETRNYSRELHGKSFITKNELDRDELSYESQKSNVTLAWNDLDLLINYTLFKEKLELFQGVTNSDLELAQVKASNSARLAKENADLESAKAERDLAKERLENYEQQIKNATITAPNPGIVVYAVVGDGRRSDPISSESEIRENQDIILLPDTTKMVADLKVQEADRDKVLPGQTAMITTDQGLSFPGRVARVAPLPDSGSRWSNNDRKVYKTRVEIQADNSSGVLRPNMSCKVEIIISHVPDVLSVPTPAVLRQGRVHYVWKQKGGVPVATKVTIGAVSQSSVEIKEGLAEGDVVYKAPPEGFEAPRFEQPDGMQLAPAEGITAPDPAARAAAEAAAAEPMTEEERAALMEEVRTFLIAEYPDREEDFAGESRTWMRQLFTDQDMKARIENHPELGPRYARYTAEMMSRFRQGGGGGRGNRTPGEGGGRTPGEGGGRGGRNRGGNSGGDESGGGETGGRRQGGRGPGGGGQ